MTATRVEQHIIRKTHPLWKTIDKNCFYSKNLYNFANYVVRQEFINNNNYINYYDMAKMLKGTEPYKELMSQPSQCTLQWLDRAWKSYFKSIKDWSKNPSKYLGKPKLPKYLKKDGRYPWYIKNTCCFIQDNGEIFFRVNRLKGHTFTSRAEGKLQCIRFIPRGSVYVMEVVTEIEVPDTKELETKRIASIDLGVTNFATITNNIGQQPIIIKGGDVKSINQFYNKRKAELQSSLKLRHNATKSKALDVLHFKRSNRIKTFMHTATKRIIDWCLENKIDTIVVGRNKEWKQDSPMRETVNQAFIFIPYHTFQQQLEYKCQNVGIKYIEVDESYTSGTSFLDNETPYKENYNKSRRTTRGLFKSGKGLVNADVNGSLQIMKNAFPNVKFDYGIGVVSLQPVIHRDVYHQRL